MPKVEIINSLYQEIKDMALLHGLSIREMINCIVHATLENNDYIDNLGIILMEVRKLE